MRDSTDFTGHSGELFAEQNVRRGLRKVALDRRRRQRRLRSVQLASRLGKPR